MSSRVSQNPYLLKEWDYEKNNNIEPEELTTGSHVKVWWIGECGHSWEMSIRDRAKGYGCPICAGKRVNKGVNDLNTLFPNVAKEWHPAKNGDLLPSNVSSGSSKMIWWRCKNGHEWQATIKSRTKGTGCPYCSGRKAISGENDLYTLFPEIAKEWNYTKNGDVLPSEVLPTSNKKIWWKCSKGHEWQAVVAQRVGGTGCPYCSNRIVLQGYNDLATTEPKLAAEWHPIRNGDLKPTDVTRGSGKKVWWRCEKGHEWQATPNKRTSDKTSCPFCSNQKVLKGFNDLATTNPRIAAEWHPTKNGSLTPCDIVEGSSKQIWWKCSKGHEWQATPSNRIKNRNCPICGKQRKTSFPEQATFYYIKQYYNDAENANANEIGMELDIYIPSIKTAIEYDGVLYHNSKGSFDREKKKNLLCKENNIRLIRIREKGLVAHSECECIIVKNPSNYGSISNAIVQTLELLGVNNSAVNIEKDMAEILSSYLRNEEVKSLLNINPELAAEWHPTKNRDLKPEHLAENSSRLVWWVCKNGHEWQASLHNRSKGKGCPYCSGRKAIPGENDLATLFPGIIAEWDEIKNTPLLPTDVKPGSSRKVWWKCSTCGFEWKTAICNRTKGGTGCPKCGEIKKGPSRKTHEQFCEEMESVNENIEIIGRYTLSNQKVQCKCRLCGKIWEATPSNLLQGKGCPSCARMKKNNPIKDQLVMF